MYKIIKEKSYNMYDIILHTKILQLFTVEKYWSRNVKLTDHKH
jgi:hypothetical protein